MVDVASLRGRVSGPVLTRDDPGFAEEVTGWVLNYSQSPEIAVGATSAADVVEAVKFADANGLCVRALGSGHGADEQISDGVLVTTRRLDTLTIDQESHLAVIGAGLQWARVVEAAAPLGLVPITGSSPSVGAVGFLLGGGLGPLVRSHGFASDWVRGFQVVTGGGDLVTANAEENTELFWALRGGKGGLGIVTEVTIELAELSTIYGGSLTFDAPDIETVFRAWVEYIKTADERVSTSVAIMRVPDLPFVPEIVRGRTLLALRFAYPGDAATGEQLAAPLRAAAPVFIDALGEMSVANMGAIHADPPEPTIGWVRGCLLSAIDPALADAVLDFAAPDKQFPFVALEIRHLGPASAKDVPGGSAVSGRSAKGTFNLVGAPNPALFETVIPNVANAVFGAIAPWICSESNINFAMPFTTRAAYEAIWPAEIFARLQTVRATHDPKGTFVYGV